MLCVVCVAVGVDPAGEVGVRSDGVLAAVTEEGRGAEDTGVEEVDDEFAVEYEPEVAGVDPEDEADENKSL